MHHVILLLLEFLRSISGTEPVKEKVFIGHGRVYIVTMSVDLSNAIIFLRFSLFLTL